MLPTPALAAWLLSGTISSAVAVRILVDDASPAWVYKPSESNWNAITPTDPCTICNDNPDPTRALNGTWHDTAFPDRTAQLIFTGIAIEIYAICPPPLRSGGAYRINFSFTLDTFTDGMFIGPSPACINFTYNYLVYARTNLSLSQHSFAITNNEITGLANSSNLLLDYAIYDNGSPTPPVSSPSATPSIAKDHTTFPLFSVIVPVAIAGLLILANIFLFWIYRRSPERSVKATASGPMIDGITSSFIVEPHLNLGPQGYTGAPVIMQGIENTAGVTDNPKIPPESLNDVVFAPSPSTWTTHENAIANNPSSPTPSTSAIASTSTSPEPQSGWTPDIKTNPPWWSPPGHPEL